ncbi:MULTISPECIES: MurT ligase domain-containing protein [unclassified Solwaraspora]|uniref:Mur ligase family protein n=1 Tax=unclassified Solwaraspora TaxID=2627926 RepID=UPI00248C6758|nr:MULTISPECIES: MurT ligase domain-containing protein [unclassified Solwaraspora]WBC00335.1 MurT ligase domain-containing protein [Solwaraspora sp. WMMA2059]WBC23591.1 MurT ligase domain-containing protein [Solwaraspora sp. WMMA2080]WJK37721.1 MurT ligase domain-containing protein [Solwaraspora sp. WMMA2065]
MPLRAKVASSVSRTAAALSRAAGRGDGSVIGGWIGLKIDPELLAHLAAGRSVALVSGTNGKTTTTRLAAAAVGVLGRVATNSYGANMPTGHTSALAKAGTTPYAVLEVDEHYLAQVLEATSPRVVALLNLSRDQLDRAKEVAMMAQLWQVALAEHPEVKVVANADDPMVVWAAATAGSVSWFSAGQRWHDDSWVCPECGSAIERSDNQWWCAGCPLRRPEPEWVVDEDGVIDPTGAWHKVTLQLPGQVNIGNAATALAVAAEFGVRPVAAVSRLAVVTSVAGRYAQVVRNGRTIRLLLAKNPASWLEAFDMAEQAPTLLSINARDPDGLDTSWLFDVDFSPLRGRQVLITGDRAFDLAVRLEVNDVPFLHVPSLNAAISSVPPGRLEVIANYTAFQDIRAELDRVN